MKGVIPAHARGDNAQRLPHYFMPLVCHEKVPRSAFALEALFAVCDDPSKLLDCDEDLSQACIYHCLP